MPVSTRPKLPTLATPTTGNFPSDALLSACSVRTPASAASLKGPLPSAGLYSAGLPSAGLPSAPLEYPPTPSMLSAKLVDDSKPEKTPITPPLAYMDFLKTIHPASPAIASPPLTAPLPMKKAPLKRTATGESAATTETAKSDESARDSTTEDELDSAPTSASSISVDSECSCIKEQSTATRQKQSFINKPAPISVIKDASTAAAYPLSAPATGPTTFPSLRVPPSPVTGAGVVAAGSLESPAVRSPWSARSIKSPFDWDAALKARRYEIGPTPASAGAVALTSTPQQQHSARCEKKGTSIRHIREVVTRTVTYTPRMEPAPRGKRRKLNDASAE